MQACSNQDVIFISKHVSIRFIQCRSWYWYCCVLVETWEKAVLVWLLCLAPAIVDGEHCAISGLSVCLFVHTYSACCDISVLCGRISLKLGMCIRHMSGHGGNGFLGQRVKRDQTNSPTLVEASQSTARHRGW